MSSIGSVDLALAALKHGFDGRARQGQDRVQAGRRLSVRALEGGRVAQLFLPPYGLLAGVRAPGGSGPARRVEAAGQELARSAGPAFALRSYGGPAADSGFPWTDALARRQADLAYQQTASPAEADPISSLVFEG
jgi:hypothetical protein